jgi:hypothetical protein
MTNDPESTFFIPTKDSIFMDILTGSLGARVNVVNLYDMAQFVEDFVLNDRLLVYPSLYNMLQPDLRRVFPETNSLLFEASEAIFPFARQAQACLLKLDKAYLEKILSLAEKIGEIRQPKGGREETYYSALKHFRESHILLLETCIQYHSAERDMWEIITTLSRNPTNHSEDISLENLLSGSSDSEKILEIAQKVQSLCRSVRVNISPGIGYAAYFMKAESSRPSAIKLLYETVASSHQEIIRRIEETGGLRIVYIPPLLSILLGRAKNREYLLEELIKLRSEFKDLREQGRYFREGVRLAATLREKIDILNEFDRSREALVKKLSSKPSRSVIKEVWDIVKGKSLWGAFTKIADLALQWDQDRQLIRRVSHFQLMSDLVLTIPRYESLLEKIYGRAAINYRDFKIKNDPWKALVKAQACLAASP